MECKESKEWEFVDDLLDWAIYKELNTYHFIKFASETKDGYKFKTQSNGRDFYKSPEDMFKDEYIDNDLKAVDDAICDYYGIEKNKQNKPEE